MYFCFLVNLTDDAKKCESRQYHSSEFSVPLFYIRMSLLLDFAKVEDFFHSDNFFTQKSVFFMDISYFCNLIRKNIKHII